MTAIRILHVDDETDIREVVEISLGLDPAFATRNCGSGKEAVAVAAEWQPDIILLDVMMPVMDGPATLVQLRNNATTANIPVIFMTARAQAREVDHFRSLGAIGVIPKPFDPMTLAAAVRCYVEPVRSPLDDRLVLRDGSRLPSTLDRIKRIAHGLAGAAGIYGFAQVSEAAAALEDAVIAELADSGSGDETDLALDGLIFHAENCGDSAGQMAPSLQTA